MQNVQKKNGDKHLTNIKSWSELEKEGIDPIDIRKGRLAICNTCEHAQNDGRCYLCGCSISSETARPNARCPVRKW
jgi:hypothetical protein